MKNLFVFLGMAVCLSFSGMAQEYHWEIKYLGLGWHPSEASRIPEYMPLKLDKEGYFVLNLGATTGIERYFGGDSFLNRFGIEFVGGMYFDCVMNFSSLMHIGFRGKIIDSEKHGLNAGLGPTIVFRKNWSDNVPDYIDQRDYYNVSRNEKYQYKFIWYAGEIEYNYKFDPHNYLSVSLIPGFPNYVLLMVGYERKIKYNNVD